jgi:YnbE-like lipoprotein
MIIFTLTRASAGAKRLVMKQVLILPFAATAVLLAGCVQVSAPDKPIEINLNINVKQEVIVRLQKDAQDLIDNNPELFPK